MSNTLHIIYITGLGDENYPKGQIAAVNRWPKYGVTAEVFRMKWGDRGSWQPKLELLIKHIDELISSNTPIGLVGVSAGGSAAISAYGLRKKEIVGVVLLSGKVLRPESVGPSYITNNPALVDAVKSSAAAVKDFTEADLAKIQSRYSLLDWTVARQDSHLSGATNKRYLIPGHFLSIAYQITFGARGIIKFLKQLNS